MRCGSASPICRGISRLADDGGPSAVAEAPRASALELPHTPFSKRVDPLLAAVGSAISWIWVLLLAVIVCNVVLRYVFGEGRVEFEEIQWHLYSIGFMLGLGYALQADSHVRVDVLHERLRRTTRAWIELYGLILCVLPFVALMLIYGVPFVAASFAAGEVSSSPGGLPYRWAIKAVLVLGFALLGLAASSRITRLWKFLFLGGASAR